MEQKDYRLEMVKVLSKGEGHIRRIADVLGVNHMMVVRRLEELKALNIVDFRMEGRNKVYFLRENGEARAYLLMMENYVLANFLLKHSFLREVIFKIQRDSRIKFACIFGSYAKDSEGRGSDVDIYLDVSDSKIAREYLKLDSKFSVKIGEWDSDNLLIKEIVGSHVLIKGAEVYYERVFG